MFKSTILYHLDILWFNRISYVLDYFMYGSVLSTGLRWDQFTNQSLRFDTYSVWGQKILNMWFFFC